VAAARAAHRCFIPRAHQRPIALTRRHHVPWPLRVPPTAALPPAPTNFPSRRRGDAVCRGRSTCRGPLPHHPRPPMSHRADAEPPRVVAAMLAADRCPTTRAHQRPIAPSWRRRVPGRLRVPPTAARPPAPTNVPSRWRGDTACRGRSACRLPLLQHPRQPTFNLTDAETPCAVAAPRAADRCPTTRAHQRPIAPPDTMAADATDEATSWDDFSYSEDTGCYSLPPKRPASALPVADHDESEGASTSTCHTGCAP